MQGERKVALVAGASGVVALPVDLARWSSVLPAQAAGSYVRRALPYTHRAGGRIGMLCALNLYFEAGEQRVHLALAVRRVGQASGSLRLAAVSFPGVSVQPAAPIELAEVQPSHAAFVVLRHEARVVADGAGLATVALSGIAQGVEVEWVAATVVGP